MHVGWKFVGVIEGADADKPDQPPEGAAHVVMAPHSDLAFCAANDVLTGAAWGWYGILFDCARGELDVAGFVQSVDGESRARVLLAPTTVATVDDHWA